MDLRQNILNKSNQLSPELMKAAQFVLDHEQQLMVLSMRAFAVKAEVKPATLLRLAQQLGYSGWAELKDDFIQSIGLKNDTYVLKAQKIIENNNEKTLYDTVFKSQISNIINTQQKNKESLEEIVNILDDSDTVYICGFRASFPIAWSIFYIYRLFKKNVILIDGLASNIEIYSREFLAQDTLIIIGFAPYSRETFSVLDAAEQAGSKIIAITDTIFSPLARKSHKSLYFYIDSPSFFPSIVSGMGISESLLVALVEKHGQEAVNKIEASENFLINSKTYVMPER